MRAISGILLTLLLLLFGSMAQPEFSGMQAQAQALCTDGQSMATRPSCICRPPLKFLPGNICGSGNRPAVSPTAPNIQGVRALCEIGMVPAASGCRCQPPLALLPDGRCGNRTAAGAPCREGDNLKTRCVCNPPLMRSNAGVCIRCLPGDGDKVVNGRCIVAKRR